MKKTFYQLHVGFILSILIYMFFITMGIWCIIMSLVYKNLLLFFIGIIPVFFGIYDFVSVSYYRIIFHSDRIFVTGELSLKEHRTQFKDNILYSDIESVNVIYINKNSKKLPIKYFGSGSLRPRLYFEFVLKDKNTKWVYISFFSKKQKEKMLSIINSKTSLNLSYKELKKMDLSYYSKKKK